MQLQGATPADFTTPTLLANEMFVNEGALPRAQAHAPRTLQEFKHDLEQLAAAPRRALGLTGPLLIEIEIDVATGRVLLDSPSLARGLVRVTSTSDPPVEPAKGLTLAREIFPEVRKLVLGSLPSGAEHFTTHRFPLTLSPITP